VAEHHEVYGRAYYYDVAFERDVGPEVDFLCSLFEDLRGRRPRSAADLACGPGYHARELARRGLAVHALDLQPEMLKMGSERAAAEGVGVSWQVADIRNFALAEPVDLVACMFDGIDALLTDDDLRSHFCSVGGALGHGGLYVIECTHPREASLSGYSTFRYSGTRDGIRVDIVWSEQPPRIDLASGVAHTDVEMRVAERGREFVVRDSARERLFTPRELELCAALSGALVPVCWYGDFDRTQGLDSSARSRRMIGVFAKREPD
jgi:SAM-dependent methyltransferase